jgi:acetyl esterase
MNRLTAFFLLALVGTCPQVQAQQSKPKPDISGEKYGPHERNVLDLWKAKADKPTPLVVFIHGGGFRAGDKSQVSPLLLEHCLKAGISVAAINYGSRSTPPSPRR